MNLLQRALNVLVFYITHGIRLFIIEPNFAKMWCAGCPYRRQDLTSTAPNPHTINAGTEGSFSMKTAESSEAVDRHRFLANSPGSR